jgi:hypothetical protein
MTDEIRELIDAHLREAKESRGRSNWDRCWQLLEDSHVVSQPWAWQHGPVPCAGNSTDGDEARPGRCSEKGRPTNVVTARPDRL